MRDRLLKSLMQDPIIVTAIHKYRILLTDSRMIMFNHLLDIIKAPGICTVALIIIF